MVSGSSALVPLPFSLYELKECLVVAVREGVWLKSLRLPFVFPNPLGLTRGHGFSLTAHENE